MDEETEATEAGLALEAGDEVVGEGNTFERRAEDELTRVQDERGAVGDLHELGEILLRELGVDVGRRVVAEHAEVAVAVQVDGGRLDRRVAERLDHDAARRELLADRDVGQDHGRGA